MNFYSQAQRKSERSAIVANIITTLRAEGALFVKFDKKSGQWFDIGDKDAKMKTAHAIRDRLHVAGNPVRGGPKAQANATSAGKKQQSASDSNKRPTARYRQQRGSRKQRINACNRKDDTESQKGAGEAAANITDSADTTICTSDDPIDFALHDAAHQDDDDASLFDSNLLDPDEQLPGTERIGSHLSLQHAALSQGINVSSAGAFLFDGSYGNHSDINPLHFQGMNGTQMNSEMILHPNDASGMMRMPFLGSVYLPQIHSSMESNTNNTLDNSHVAIQSMMGNRQKQQQIDSTPGHSTNVDRNNPHPVAAPGSMQQKQPPKQQSSFRMDTVMSSGTSLDPLPFIAVAAGSSERYSVIDAGLLDGKLQAEQLLGMCESLPATDSFSSREITSKDHYSLKDGQKEDRVGKYVQGNNGESRAGAGGRPGASADEDHLKGDDHDFKLFEDWGDSI
jgi:hypothetical protein